MALILKPNKTYTDSKQSVYRGNAGGGYATIDQCNGHKKKRHQGYILDVYKNATDKAAGAIPDSFRYAVQGDEFDLYFTVAMPEADVHTDTVAGNSKVSLNSLACRKVM